jgi:putative ABC transport system permease protein
VTAVAFLRSVLSDVRFAFRLLRRAPGFFATLLAILVAGIGATTATFSIVESLLLRPLPYPHPERLVVVWSTPPDAGDFAVSTADFLDLRAGGTSFEAMAAVDGDRFNLSSEGRAPESTLGAGVSGEFFAVMGVQPLRGRLLGPDDDHVGAPPVAVISASLWHGRFGSDPGLVGRSIVLDGRPFAIVGIAPEGFRFSGPYHGRCDVWTPLTVTHPGEFKDIAKSRGSHNLNVVGRLAAGVSLEQAQAQLQAVAHRLELAYPESNAKEGVHLVDLHDQLVGPARAGVWLLFAAVALVFLIVCSNVANLLLTRAQSRRAEMAARAALGATPARLVRQMLTETAVVFLLGSLAGTALARSLLDLFAAGLLEGGTASTIDIRVDSVALGASVLVCLACGVLFGLVPALAVARVEPQTVLKDSAARAGIGRPQRRIRDALVIAQVALACVLLVGAGLALKAFAKIASTPPGFDPVDVATASVFLPTSTYSSADRKLAFYRAVMARIAAQPGVEAVAGSLGLPMGNSSLIQFDIEGRPPWPPGEKKSLQYSVVTPAYFGTLGIPLLRGRAFTDADRPEGRLVAILSRSTAEHYFHGMDAVGQRITFSDDEPKDWLEIVGVVGDVRRLGLAEPVQDEVYLPLAQGPTRVLTLVARSRRAALLLQAFPTLVAEVDPQLAVTGRSLMSERVAESIGDRRYLVFLLLAFSAAALLLATLGVFGVVSYATSQRGREIGLRMALGSTPEGVVGLVMRSGLRLVAAGLGLGLLAAVVLGRVLSEQAPELAVLDPAVYAAIPAVLALAGLLACLLPAWRAVRIAPASALRYE